MTHRSFVLIEIKGGKAKAVLDKMRQLDGVKSVDLVTGPYDVIAVVELESLNDIGDLITGRIPLIAGISRTVTCLALPTD